MTALTRTQIITQAIIRAGRRAQGVDLTYAFDEILQKITRDYPLLRNIPHPFTTVASQSWVALPSDYRSWEQCFYSTYELEWVDLEDYQNLIQTDTDTAGTPSEFTIAEDESRLYLYHKPSAATAGKLMYSAIHPKTEKTLSFTSGGTYEIKKGDTVTGATSGKTMLVNFVRVTSGSWAGGDAAGRLLGTPSATGFTAENLNVGSNLNVATIAADATTTDNFLHFLGEKFDEVVIEGCAWKALELIEDDLRAMKKQALFLYLLSDLGGIKTRRPMARSPYRGY